MSRSPGQNNRRPVAIILEDRPRRRIVYKRGAAKGNNMVKCAGCCDSICSVIALMYAAFTGLFRVWPSGQAASSGCLAMAIISTFQLFTIVRVGCCALCIACTAKHVKKAALPKPFRQG